MRDTEWWCEAYGPPAEGADPATWPRCFLAQDTALRYCLNASACSTTMTAERRRVFDRIQDLASDGDEIALGLAAEFSSPDEILNARDDAPNGGEDRPGG